MNNLIEQVINFFKWVAKNEHVQSWFATAIVYVIADSQTLLVNVAMGDWSLVTIKLLIVTVLRSVIKSLIVFLVPSIKSKV